MRSALFQDQVGDPSRPASMCGEPGQLQEERGSRGCGHTLGPRELCTWVRDGTTALGLRGATSSSPPTAALRSPRPGHTQCSRGVGSRLLPWSAGRAARPGSHRDPHMHGGSDRRAPRTGLQAQVSGFAQVEAGGPAGKWFWPGALPCPRPVCLQSARMSLPVQLGRLRRGPDGPAGLLRWGHRAGWGRGAGRRERQAV